MNLFDLMLELGTRPIPWRSVLVRKLLRRWPIGSYASRLRVGAVDRPAYGMCLYHAALQAKALGHTAITAIEFGVAGGNGLVSLCQHAHQIKNAIGIDVLVVGFDSGGGLPASHDPRDVLYHWPPGSFEMDRKELEKRLSGRAELVLGNVADTVKQWEPRPEAPIGTVIFDLDFYSSTVFALSVLTKRNVLPRIWCYFDDIFGPPEGALSDSTGERAAINEFNSAPERLIAADHLSPAYVFMGRPPEYWHQQIYVYHRLKHPSYSISLAPRKKSQLPLSPA